MTLMGYLRVPVFEGVPCNFLGQERLRIVYKYINIAALTCLSLKSDIPEVNIAPICLDSAIQEPNLDTRILRPMLLPKYLYWISLSPKAGNNLLSNICIAKKIQL